MRPPNDSSSDRLTLGWLLAANAFPVVGVVVGGWNLATLAVVYWIEIGIVLLWSVLFASLAELPPEGPGVSSVDGTRNERSEIPIPKTGLAVQTRNLPSVAVAGLGLGACWALIGLGVLGQLIDLSAATDGRGRSVRIAALWLFVSEGGAMGSEYVLNRRYRERNAQQVLRRGVLPVIGLGSVLLIVAAPVDSVESDLPLLGALVAGKLLMDLLRTYSDRIRAYDEKNGGWLGLADEDGPHE